MRVATCGLLAFVGAAVPLASAACGGAVAGAADGGDDRGRPGRPTPTASADAGAPRDARPEAPPVDTHYPATHPPLPTDTSFGESTLAHPVFVPVTFPGDPSQSDIVAFTNGIGATTYWSTIVAQYGVGAAVGGTPVILTPAEEPPGTGGTLADADVQSWLEAELTSGALAGTNTPETVYAIYFPAGTTITLPIAGATAVSCMQFGGYHLSFRRGDTGEAVSYVVIPRCSDFPTASGVLFGIDAITGAASHELLEAVTDPQPYAPSPGYVQPDERDLYWAVALGGGEIGDLCAQFPDAFYRPAGFGYTVQRAWSNAAALASHDPCQPSLTPAEVYFNSVPVLTPTNADLEGTPVRTDAVTIPLHGSTTVEIDLYSDGPTSGPWSVQASDALEFQGYPPSLSFTWDRTTGANGDRLHLTITAQSSPPAGVDGFVLVSQLGTQSTLSVGMVVVK